MKQTKPQKQVRANSVQLVLLAAVYFLLQILCDRIGQVTALSGSVSLWYPAAGLILAIVLRLRLIGAAIAIASSLLGFWIFGDESFSTASGLTFCIVSPLFALVIRAVMRRMGYVDPRAVTRPQMALAMISASTAFALFNATLGFTLARFIDSNDSFDLSQWTQWFLGDLVGCLAVGLVALQLIFPLLLGQMKTSLRGLWHWLPAILGYGLLSLLPWGLSKLPGANSNYPLVFLSAVPVFYAALRRGYAETSLALTFANLGFMIAVTNDQLPMAIELQILALMINAGGIMTAAITTNQSAMLRALQTTLGERDALMNEKMLFQTRLAEAQRLDALGKMAGGLAHEINNLLHPIKSFARSAVGAAEDKRAQYLGRITECADSAQRIVADVLTFARESAKAEAVAPVKTSARRAIESAAAIAAEQLPASVSFSFDVNVDAAEIEIDEGGMSQVLVNLVNNARDAMPTGGSITITADVVMLDAAQAKQLQLETGCFVRIIVADTGPGMDADMQHRIFEPFFTTKDVGRGTGLGLSVVYGLVKRWHGTVQVDSSLGDGSKFSVLIPIADDDTKRG
jgi:signal transduction histidine kinase